MKIQKLIENTNNNLSSFNEQPSDKALKRDYNEKKAYLLERVRRDTHLNGNTKPSEETKVKMRNSNRRKQMAHCSSAIWRSSSSICVYDQSFEDTRIDLDKIENDLN